MSSFRVSIKLLESRVADLNEITGNAAAPWSRVDGKPRANVGTYYLDQAYGGVYLAQMTTESGGTSCPLGYVRHTKAEMLEILDAALWGYRLAKA